MRGTAMRSTADSVVSGSLWRLAFTRPGAESGRSAGRRYGEPADPDGDGVAVPEGFTVRVVARSGERIGGVAWHAAPDLVHAAVDEVATLYRAKSEIQYVRGVPPVVNDPAATALLSRAMTACYGPDAVEPTTQSLGGEDFSWYLEHVPGAMARLGVRPPADPQAPGRRRPPQDIHQGDFDADERAIPVGVELLVAAALLG